MISDSDRNDLITRSVLFRMAAKDLEKRSMDKEAWTKALTGVLDLAFNKAPYVTGATAAGLGALAYLAKREADLAEVKHKRRMKALKDEIRKVKGSFLPTQ